MIFGLAYFDNTNKMTAVHSARQRDSKIHLNFLAHSCTNNTAKIENKGTKNTNNFGTSTYKSR